MKKEYIFIFKDKAEKLIEKSLCISVIGLAHGHIYSMVKGLLNAGKSIKLKYVNESEFRFSFLLSVHPGLKAGNNLQLRLLHCFYLRLSILRGISFLY